MSKRQKRKIGWAVKPGMKTTDAQREAGWDRLAFQKCNRSPLQSETVEAIRPSLRDHDSYTVQGNDSYIIPDSLVPAFESLALGTVYTASYP